MKSTSKNTKFRTIKRGFCGTQKVTTFSGKSSKHSGATDILEGGEGGYNGIMGRSIAPVIQPATAEGWRIMQ